MMKARVTSGFSVERYYGGFGSVETPEIGVSCLDSDSTIAFKLQNQDKMKADAKVHI